MQNIEPYFNWRHLYAAEEDELSPFYGRTYSEFEFSQQYIIITSIRNGTILAAVPYT
ncbi:MAG: hypothetical protein WDM90_11140 [Ferruginibacter sp.]